jgi:uncharacterized protein (TIGR02172 family)
MYDLGRLKLIAQGGQAEIYELDDSRILRVLRNPEDKEYLLTERSIMQTLKAKGKPVPDVYDFVMINKRPSLVMEKIKGNTMLDNIRKNPFKLLKKIGKLASLQIEISDKADGLNLIPIRKRAAYLISNSDMLDENTREFVLDIIKELPDGNYICHGDFHPGNIIENGRQYYIIDWFGATSGRKLSDIAHTYLLLKNTPRAPGISEFQNFFIRLSSKVTAGKYISACRKFEAFDWGEFSKWMVVRASERVFYGMPSEKARLVKFIKACMESKKSGIGPEKWWRLI